MLVFRASHSVSQAAWLFGSYALSLLLCACSVYDSELLQGLDTLRGGAGAIDTMRDNPLITASSAPRDGNVDWGPDQVGPRPGDTEDAGTPTPSVKCGDGQVNGVEKCDTAIAAGAPGACPSNCPELERCVPRVLNGTGCQTECVLRQLTCENGDGCCPGNCTKDNDLDCSSRCGDGIVQTTGGETCEAETDQPCMTSVAQCDDDNDCTIDRLTGSAANCNVACIHEPISAPGASDGCCPGGGNARNDIDCEPRCGNGVKEDGEDCDGSEDCDPECKFLNAEERMRCAEQARTDCERCACEQCTASELACRGTADANNNRLCGDIISCSDQFECIGTPCYCGAALGCTIPAGPCRGQIEAAGGTLLQVAQQVGDPSTLVGKSYAADQCRVEKCEAACGKRM
jgi:hypothetical protein